jgi:acetyl esterase
LPLHPQARAFLDPLNAAGPIDIWTLDPDSLRAAYGPLLAQRAVEPVASVVDRAIPGPAGEIPIRVYTPEEAPEETPGERGPLPVLVYYHGGGFVICDLDTHDSICRALANAARCAVVSVDYRLAPEHRFPAGPEDCYAAACWVAEQASSAGFDASRLAVAGDSAGGNLAAVVSLLARDRGGPRIAHQLLIYPVTDCAFDTPSYRENAEGYLLTREMMRWFWHHYLGRESDAANPLASPLRAEKLGGLPPATVLTAEFDPLRDEGEAYAARLREAGVPVEATRYEGVFHGFFGMTDVLEPAVQAVSQAANALRRAFAAAPP